MKEKKKKRKTSKTIKLVFLFILLFLTIGITIFAYKTYENGGGISGIIATVMGQDIQDVENLENLEVLLMGVSNGIDAKLSDTIMIASYNPKIQKASLISIPRDTFIGSNTKYATPNDKINAIYSYTQDPEAVLKKVNKLMGLKIEKYLVIETEALVKVVDAIGGVTFNVPIDMKYDDISQDLEIDLKAGVQLLNGRDAEGLVRFRKNNNGTTYPLEYGSDDTGRMRTQREFLIQVAKQTCIPSNIFKLGEFLDILKENVTTNVDFEIIKKYLPFAVEFDVTTLNTSTIPGENILANETWIFKPSTYELKEFIQQQFSFREEIDTKTLNTSKIHFINAGTSNVIANKAENSLKNAGYKKVEADKCENEVKSTIIIGNSNTDKRILKDIQAILGSGEIEIEEINNGYDVQIIFTQ